MNTDQLSKRVELLEQTPTKSTIAMDEETREVLLQLQREGKLGPNSGSYDPVTKFIIQMYRERKI